MKKHLVIGTVVCLATMLLFLAFYGKMPDSIPLQIRVDGSVGNAIPKPLLTFGMPVAFAVINLVRGLTLSQRDEAPAYGFYIVPGIAVLLSIVTVVMALNIS